MGLTRQKIWFHGSIIQKSLLQTMFQIQFFTFFLGFGFCPLGHLMSYQYHLPNIDNRGHLANYHLPHFVHVVIQRPLKAKLGTV